MNRDENSFLENTYREWHEKTREVFDDYYEAIISYQSRMQECLKERCTKLIKLGSWLETQIILWLKQRLGKDFQFFLQWMSKLAIYEDDIVEPEKVPPIDYFMWTFLTYETGKLRQNLLEQRIDEGFPELETDEEREKAALIVCKLTQ